MFIEQYAREFRDGWICEDAFATFNVFCDTNGFKRCNVKMFGLKMRDFTDHVRRQRNGGRSRYYVLQESKYEMFHIEEDADDCGAEQA
jgi:hypothetical protein